MTAKYCYWSVATGPYGALMENCARSARAAGVFKDFHVLTDRRLEGCECYDAYDCDKQDGLFKLHYLKLGMGRLLYDYFIWLDADTVLVSNPVDILGALGRSPIHVPLELKFSTIQQDGQWKGMPCGTLNDLYSEMGVVNQPYLCRSAFWIIRRDAIDTVYELAFQFVNHAKQKGIRVNADAALGYAMQLLCADPEAHLLSAHPELWASDDQGYFSQAPLSHEAWPWRHPLHDQPTKIRPALVHLPELRRQLGCVNRSTVSAAPQ